MYKVDKNFLKTALIVNLKYPPIDAERFVEDFPDVIPEPLDVPYRQWVQGAKDFEDVEVDGLSLKKVMELRIINIVVAIRYLYRLLDPDLPEDQRMSLKSMLQRKFEPE